MSCGPPSTWAREGAAAKVVVSASLDNLRSSDVRFLQEAARFGGVHVRLPSDGLVEARTGRPPHFPQAERRFLATSLRYVDTARVVQRETLAALPDLAARYATVVVRAEAHDGELRAGCHARGIDYRVVPPEALTSFPSFDVDGLIPPGARRRVVVTGCFDWLHSGHVRFFMDAAALGDLYVVIGSDRNVKLLKGPGHPLQRENERRYMVQAVRSVRRCLVSSGSGWMDAEPEIDAIAPHMYVVNEDGDQPEKREFCRAHGIEYVVLERRPHRDLPARSSTELRGF